MPRTVKHAAVMRHHGDSHDQLRAHLDPVLDPYNNARGLKTLPGLTPYEPVRRTWTKQHDRSTPTPSRRIPGPCS